MWWIMLFLFVSIIFWAIKGVMVKKTAAAIPLAILTIGVWYVLFIINNRIEGAVHWVFFGYLAMSALFYVLFLFGVSPFERILFSGVYVKTDEVNVKYFWLKPVTWVCANVFLLCKGYALVGLCETVEIDVVSRGNVTVNVRL